MLLQLQRAIFVMGNCSAGCDACCLLQVNKDIVSGLKYIQQSFRKGVKGKATISFNLSAIEATSSKASYTPSLPLSNVQLTSRTTWSAATGPDQTRNTSSSPPWRSRPKGCWPAAPTTSSPSSPTTTNTIISPGSGASLSRKTGKTDSPPRHRRLPLLRPSFFFSLSFHYFCLDPSLDYVLI